VATAANRFTVVDPTSKADTDADGVPDVVEAAYGTDPLNPKSFPSSNSIPVFGGEADAMPFSVLNTAPPAGSPAATGEADALPFSVLNTAPPPGSPAATMEADGIPFSVLNTAPPPGSQAATLEADGVCFSVYNGVQAPLGLACANGTLDESISASGNKKGESHVSKTKPPAP
jgi:hypothetical protein